MLSKLEQLITAINIYLHMLKCEENSDEYIVAISKVSKKILDTCSKILIERSK